MNPTPWDVKLDYDRGIRIRIPAFGSVDLSMQQMDDYRPGKPGSEAVAAIMDTYGVFLFDSDRSYDNQALEALKRNVRVLSDQYKATERRLRDQRSAQGINPDEKALKATLVELGYGTVQEKIATLEEQIQKYEQVVSESTGSVRAKLDPARTVFVMNPPREFPSVAAMEFFLAQPENAELKTKHEGFISRQNAESTTQPAAPSDPEAVQVQA
jgi:hypothetical protein